MRIPVIAAIFVLSAQGCAKRMPDFDDPARGTPLAALVPEGVVQEPGIVLAMIGTDTCSASVAFRPFFFESLELPLNVKRRYIEKKVLAPDFKYYPSPAFVLFVDGRPIDIHAGAVLPSNNFAPSANAQIFAGILRRNGLADGEEWSLAVNKLQHPDRDSFDYQPIRFVKLEGVDFSGRSFVRTLFSDVILDRANLTGAKFDGTVMAHVSLKGALITDEQASAIIWLNSVCPDGTRSERNGGSCAGHTRAVP